jgi:hypothetical protein
MRSAWALTAVAAGGPAAIATGAATGGATPSGPTIAVAITAAGFFTFEIRVFIDRRGALCPGRKKKLF